MNESSDNSDRSVMEEKRLSGHQIDVIRRAIIFLIARDGEALLAKLGIYLSSLNESGFRKEDEWCGYHKLATMIGAYPNFFEIYDNEANAKAVRIVANLINTASATTQQSLNMNFDEFVWNNFTDDFVNEICSEYGLKDGLEDPCVFRNFMIYTIAHDIFLAPSLSIDSQTYTVILQRCRVKKGLNIAHLSKANKSKRYSKGADFLC